MRCLQTVERKREALERFENLCPMFGDASDLEEANWLLGAALLRGFEAAPYRQRLDAWGAELRRRLRRAPGDTRRLGRKGLRPLRGVQQRGWAREISQCNDF